jgi:hypothetical protein
MTPFTRTLRESQYSAVATYKVHGFWSNSTITVTTTTYDGKKWEEPSIKWSSGGRDPKEEPDNFIAISCFADALKDAVILAREWKAKYTEQVACTP